MQYKIESQREFKIGAKQFVINLYSNGSDKYEVKIFEKITCQGNDAAQLKRGNTTISNIPYKVINVA